MKRQFLGSKGLSAFGGEPRGRAPRSFAPLGAEPLGGGSGGNAPAPQLPTAPPPFFTIAITDDLAGRAGSKSGQRVEGFS